MNLNLVVKTVPRKHWTFEHRSKAKTGVLITSNKIFDYIFSILNNTGLYKHF